MHILNQCYQGKTVLVTGHTGFKGSWLALWLQLMGAKVIGYALGPKTDRDNFVCTHLSEKMVDVTGDIRDRKRLEKVFQQYEPDFVFHLAAQPIVRLSYEEPVETYEVNVMGTINVLECMRASSKKQVGIFITTDKCYDNKEQIWGYREMDALGGYDPYSSSKAGAELAIACWRNAYMNPAHYESHHKSIASVRAGNVIGGGDWAKDRIVPDCIRSFEANLPVTLRNPSAIRPWQHVLEPLYGYLLLGARIDREPERYCEAWNFGPYTQQIVPVETLVQKLIAAYGKGRIEKEEAKVHEAQLLSLDISKSRWRLGWEPTLNLEETIAYTVDWYKNYSQTDVYDLCMRQIQDFMSKQEREE